MHTSALIACGGGGGGEMKPQQMAHISILKVILESRVHMYIKVRFKSRETQDRASMKNYTGQNLWCLRGPKQLAGALLFFLALTGSSRNWKGMRLILRSAGLLMGHSRHLPRAPERSRICVPECLGSPSPRRDNCTEGKGGRHLSMEQAACFIEKCLLPPTSGGSTAVSAWEGAGQVCGA